MGRMKHGKPNPHNDRRKVVPTRKDEIKKQTKPTREVVSIDILLFF